MLQLCTHRAAAQKPPGEIKGWVFDLGGVLVDDGSHIQVLPGGRETFQAAIKLFGRENIAICTSMSLNNAKSCLQLLEAVIPEEHIIHSTVKMGRLSFMRHWSPGPTPYEAAAERLRIIPQKLGLCEDTPGALLSALAACYQFVVQVPHSPGIDAVMLGQLRRYADWYGPETETILDQHFATVPSISCVRYCIWPNLP